MRLAFSELNSVIAHLKDIFTVAAPNTYDFEFYRLRSRDKPNILSEVMLVYLSFLKLTGKYPIIALVLLFCRCSVNVVLSTRILLNYSSIITIIMIFSEIREKKENITPLLQKQE